MIVSWGVWSMLHDSDSHVSAVTIGCGFDWSFSQNCAGQFSETCPGSFCNLHMTLDPGVGEKLSSRILVIYGTIFK